MQEQRRSLIKRLFGSIVAATGLGMTATAAPKTTDEVKQAGNIEYDQEIPLFSGHTKLGNMVFIAGKGAHFKGDIKSHTDHVLKELEKELILAGSSMEKVLKVHGDRHPELSEISRLFQTLEYDLRPHLEKEEQILFPYIRSLEQGGEGFSGSNVHVGSSSGRRAEPWGEISNRGVPGASARGPQRSSPRIIAWRLGASTQKFARPPGAPARGPRR